MTHTSSPRSADSPQSKGSPDNIPADLFDVLAQMGAPVDDPNRKLTTAEEFERHHAAYPLAYDGLAAIARHQIREVSPGRIGFALVWETARWEIRRRTKGDVRVYDNNWRAWYSRLLMFQEPDLAGAWETRRAPEADAWIASLAAQAQDPAA